MITYRPYQIEANQALFDYFPTHATHDSEGNPVPANPLVALPTGTGKSLCIGGFAHRALIQHPGTKLLMLTHVKELIEQNAKALLTAWPQAPLGIYSAGLKQRNSSMPIIYGGIASAVNKLELFGWRDLMIIDEAHLISPKDGTMYQKVFEHFRKLNPYFRVIGFTATKFRKGQGLLTDPGGIFTHTCYDLTTIEGFNRLLHEGWLAPLIPKRTHLKLDLSNVGIDSKTGDYKQGDLARDVNVRKITQAACIEACAHSERQSWLAFCSGIEHAENTAEILRGMGVNAAAVHSKMPDAERDARIAAFKTGELRCLTNNNVLTTGFDHPPIDLILMLRPTTSPVLWVQMCGRGTRPSPVTHKTNCLVLDFARNTERLGPINDPSIPRPKGPSNGEIPVKICEVCEAYNHISARFCHQCGAPFEFETKIIKQASTEELIRNDWPITEIFPVDRVLYSLFRKPGSPDAIRVMYFSGHHDFTEFVRLEHGGYPRQLAVSWWRQRHWSEPPTSSRAALEARNDLRTPKFIKVHTNKIFPEIVGVEF